MFSSRVKVGVFVLEGLNALATTLYFTYLFFNMRDRFGFSNLQNLALAATSGLVYTVGVWYAGQFAQRRGYFLALKLGFSVMGVAMLLGSSLRTVPGQYAAMILWTLGMCFTWPCLEAITSERESPTRLKRLLGIYNVVWSTGGGVATFVGGAVLEHLGAASIYLVPATLHAIQVALVIGLERSHRGRPAPTAAAPGGPLLAETEARRSPVSPRAFLLMAWVANPFAYVAMNAVIPVIPGLAHKFALTPAQAGVFASVWLLARAAGFLLLWQWTRWHYRFRWLLGAYLAMAGGFATILLGGNLWLLVAAQVGFGIAVALIYYSSLYYSMDVGETKGEHGGFHEAAIGAGIFGGPAVGAASLYFFPAQPNMNAWAVTALLMVGLAWLVRLRRGGARRGR